MYLIAEYVRMIFKSWTMLANDTWLVGKPAAIATLATIVDKVILNYLRGNHDATEK